MVSQKKEAKVFDIREWRERNAKRLQDEANRRAYPIILENIKHLTVCPEGPDKGEVG